MAREKLRELETLAKQHVLEGEFNFSAGGKQRFYFDGRMLNLSPRAPLLVGNLVWERVASLLAANIKIDALGGPVLGAAPLVTATQVVAYLQGNPLPAFLVRESVKEHGAQKIIEGHLPTDGSVVILEDTVSSGASVFRAIQAAEERRSVVIQVIALLDWQKGGGERLRSQGYDFRPFLVGNLDTGEIRLS